MSHELLGFTVKSELDRKLLLEAIGTVAKAPQGKEMVANRRNINDVSDVSGLESANYSSTLRPDSNIVHDAGSLKNQGGLPKADEQALV